MIIVVADLCLAVLAQGSDDVQMWSFSTIGAEPSLGYGRKYEVTLPVKAPIGQRRNRGRCSNWTSIIEELKEALMCNLCTFRWGWWRNGGVACGRPLELQSPRLPKVVGHTCEKHRFLFRGMILWIDHPRFRTRCQLENTLYDWIFDLCLAVLAQGSDYRSLMMSRCEVFQQLQSKQVPYTRQA